MYSASQPLSLVLIHDYLPIYPFLSFTTMILSVYHLILHPTPAPYFTLGTPNLINKPKYSKSYLTPSAQCARTTPCFIHVHHPHPHPPPLSLHLCLCLYLSPFLSSIPFPIAILPYCHIPELTYLASLTHRLIRHIRPTCFLAHR